MAVEGEKDIIAIRAGADLSGSQYLAVTVGGTIAAENNTAVGILQNKPAAAGRDAAVAYEGHMKAKVTGAVSAGDRLKVTTGGYLTASGSGDGPQVARALADASSGAVCEVLADFVTAMTNYNGA